MRRRLLLLLVLSLAVAALAIPARPADACSCAAGTAQAHFDAADAVFLARAGKTVKHGDKWKQTFEVLHVLKGAPGRKFTWLRVEESPLCGAEHQAGAYAVLFERGGELGLCAGNFHLTTQLEWFPDLLKASQQKTGVVSFAAMKRGLAVALKPYLHQRRNVPVVYSPLAGKSFRLGKSSLSFRKAPRGMEQKSGRLFKNQVFIDQALSFGKLSFISASYPIEGFSFFALVLDRGKQGQTVLAHSGSES